MDLSKANDLLVEKYGNVAPQIETYEEDDGTIWYRYWYFDGFEETWDGFETVAEAFDSLCDLIDRCPCAYRFGRTK